jgi:hypothetical protein
LKRPSQRNASAGSAKESQVQDGKIKSSKSKEDQPENEDNITTVPKSTNEYEKRLESTRRSLKPAPAKQEKKEVDDENDDEDEEEIDISWQPGDDLPTPRTFRKMLDAEKAKLTHTEVQERKMFGSAAARPVAEPSTPETFRKILAEKLGEQMLNCKQGQI